MKLIYPLLLSCLLSLSLSYKDSSSRSDRSGWTNYAGHKDGNRYSSNEEINLQNIGDLQAAWTYSTSDKDTATGVRTSATLLLWMAFCTERVRG